MRKFKLLLTAALLLITSLAWSQTKTITGKVIDEEGNPISFASILEKGTTNGTSANTDGGFSLTLKSGNTIAVSAAGFQSQDVSISNSSLTIVLKRASDLQESVVVTALGISRNRKVLSYNPQVIKSDLLQDKGDNNLLSLLQGKIAVLILRDLAVLQELPSILFYGV
ncbi:carboxypeptidase-like regulatory domain-containing protein [Niabella hibiscisoli]|uniref:carboxypeptidase-like regulatory domain-containing protein n=1 Tax=Niabella hibiscisoli TaxID=1825928 RepID=UPI001F10881F|nr:carboxypeptidase-like regulatory domain-containing protein [Niabella hibiscisoli]MCH5717075.1 carboxypeptidase-like regulatory domain-containing protein [Niabella hibiscisoli]